METYYAVIFTSQRTERDGEGYGEMAEIINTLAQQQPGFLRVESVRNDEGRGITVSYWESLEAIQAWKDNAKHLTAQQLGKGKWYTNYQVEICQIIKEYSFVK
ncbi:antibiotic biosynthesis monooxygenase [Lysinibacillus irui]|uniref:Antibiotic biosynthesis monooxygenase n=1 Tax=Lysinibacillus irui TaxID=2998077 RepID=A0ABU5NGZ7_9BACI|nr:antibiotic biosynthesis monooxygenase [Lysinibacillus irui]MEA0552734.1 antibiotic biosynthesis monooxygenase [Lysinibacillus irui]MEA0565993.1 antibiotic biosynthesis monooxygenase [Lysinibacillus irui]MEA0975314.1 antibiotic biosynthesis monooxygenase [Lysinibacillus irui]MEA1041468.1 antibiotic biosynthesis monooxygenase [Lysinibacillus irui]